MPANLVNSAVATGLEKVSFHSNPKKGNAKECSNYHTIAVFSHTGKVMLKSLQVRLQQYMNRELPDVQAGFRKGKGTRDHIANLHWIIEKRSRKISASALLTTPKPLTMWITTLWKILKEIGIPDHFTCLLRNLYAGQEATVRMRTDLFQSCGHCWVFQICWLIECSTFTVLSFRIWNSSAGIPSHPLAFFIVILLKIHLASWCLALGGWSHHRGYLGHEDLFCIVFCVLLPPLLNIFCFC